MNYFVAFALLAVASASVIPPAVIASDNPEVQEILAAIQSPSTDPATAAALEQMLLEVLGLAKPEPIEVGPAIVDNYEPISIGPAIVDFPLPDPYPVNPDTVMPAPVGPAAGAPLVQIILNIQSGSDIATPVEVGEAEVVDDFVPVPVVVVDEAIAPEQVIVADSIIPIPVINLPETLN